MLKDKIQALVSKEKEQTSKKKIENIVVLIVVLIVTVMAINTIWNGDKKKNEDENINYDTGKQLADLQETSKEDTKDNSMEKNLENILSNIEGVGNVKVLISYSESSEVVAMYSENSKNSLIEETDSGGGTRTTTQNDTEKDIVYKEENGEKVPVTQKIIQPKIEGAIITAVGANNGTVKNNIVQAVEAVTGLPTHKIQVFEMKKE